MQNIAIQDALDLTKPLPYVVVTLLDKQGKPNAIGLSWVTRTSIDPPMMLISVGFQRYSHSGLRKHPEFVIHYPTYRQKEAALYCGQVSGRDDADKIANAGFQTIPASMVEVPVLKDVTVALECRTSLKFETGDHTNFVGKVIAAHAGEHTPQRLYDLKNHNIVALDNNARNIEDL